MPQRSPLRTRSNRSPPHLLMVSTWSSSTWSMLLTDGWFSLIPARRSGPEPFTSTMHSRFSHPGADLDGDRPRSEMARVRSTGRGGSRAPRLCRAHDRMLVLSPQPEGTTRARARATDRYLVPVGSAGHLFETSPQAGCPGGCSHAQTGSAVPHRRDDRGRGGRRGDDPLLGPLARFGRAVPCPRRVGLRVDRRTRRRCSTRSSRLASTASSRTIRGSSGLAKNTSFVRITILVRSADGLGR